MNSKKLNIIYAAGVFLASLVVLLMTVQPSVSFWDCGEFLAASYSLQVPHPPGAPFFLMLGRVFSFIPFGENLAYRMNMISVFSSAFSILFLYLVIVKLVENYKGRVYNSLFEAVTTYTAAAIGALSFAYSDTFWFNGVEAEVYAASTFLFAAITYLMLLWNEKADNKDNEKYILMIAYLIGLSTGVHLMSVLAIVSVVMIIMFRKYVDDENALRTSGYIFLGHAGVILAIAIAMWANQTDSTPPTAEQYAAFDSRFKMVIAGLSALLLGAFWKKLFNRNSIYLPLIVGGVALTLTYPGVVKWVPAIMAKVAGDSTGTAEAVFVAILGALGYLVWYSVKNKKPTLHLVGMSAIFILLGFTTYAMVIIRANQDPPMNENEPNDFTELVSYLNREQYGDFPTFKRRFATEPHQMIVYNEYSSDLDFWWRYQMNHMKTRYLLWNYAGRESWDQDAGANVWPMNKLANLILKPFNVKFAGDAKDSLFGIPFLLGLLGIYFHFRKDWKMASNFMILFILMGYLTAFYQNQQQPQPRERDYFYVGAFFIFSAWIGIAIQGLADLVREKLKDASTQKFAVAGVLALGVIFVPVRMLQANYHTHDRSKNYIPWDYSYNLLQSAAPNAILFTNGDNDTFPLWYLQDVEGVRRDVRIVNLSLLNTPWYIRQLKNLEPYGNKKIKMRLTDAQIAEIRPVQWEPSNFSIDVPADVLKNYPTPDSTIARTGKLTWRMEHTATFGDIKAVRVQDLLVKEIVENNNWERPIYFAVTCTEDSKIGLGDYMRMEGMAMRLVPERRPAGIEFVNAEVMNKMLLEENPSYSKTYDPRFKFRGLNDPSIFFDENHERLTQNYRNSYIRLALYYLNTNKKDKCISTLDEMERRIPRSVVKLDYRLLFDVSQLYFGAGAMDRYKLAAAEVEREALKKIEEDPSDVRSFYNPYRLLMDIYENSKEYDKAIGILGRLEAMYPNDASIKSQIQRLKDLKAGKSPDSVTVQP